MIFFTIFQTRNIWAGCHGNRHLLQIFCNIFHYFLWHFKKIDNISWILRLCISCQFKSLQRMGIKMPMWLWNKERQSKQGCFTLLYVFRSVVLDSLSRSLHPYPFSLIMVTMKTSKMTSTCYLKKNTSYRKGMILFPYWE